jgi:hypothetical protein
MPTRIFTPIQTGTPSAVADPNSYSEMEPQPPSIQHQDPKSRESAQSYLPPRTSPSKGSNLEPLSAIIAEEQSS